MTRGLWALAVMVLLFATLTVVNLVKLRDHEMKQLRSVSEDNRGYIAMKVYKVHDDASHVTCYVYSSEEKGGIHCITDGNIAIGKEMELAVEGGRAGVVE